MRSPAPDAPQGRGYSARCVRGVCSALVLLVGHLLQPLHDLAVERFLNRDMRHRGRRGGAVPMLLARREPDHVAGMNLLDAGRLRAAPSRSPRVTISVWPSGCVCQAVRAPGSKVTLAPATRAGAAVWKSGSIRTVPVNQSAGPLPEGCEPIRLMSMAVSLNRNSTRRERSWADAPGNTPRHRARSGIPNPASSRSDGTPRTHAA